MPENNSELPSILDTPDAQFKVTLEKRVDAVKSAIAAVSEDYSDQLTALCEMMAADLADRLQDIGVDIGSDFTLTFDAPDTVTAVKKAFADYKDRYNAWGKHMIVTNPDKKTFPILNGSLTVSTREKVRTNDELPLAAHIADIQFLVAQRDWEYLNIDTSAIKPEDYERLNRKAAEYHDDGTGMRTLYVDRSYVARVKLDK